MAECLAVPMELEHWKELEETLEGELGKEAQAAGLWGTALGTAGEPRWGAAAWHVVEEGTEAERIQEEPQEEVELVGPAALGGAH